MYQSRSNLDQIMLKSGEGENLVFSVSNLCL